MVCCDGISQSQRPCKHLPRHNYSISLYWLFAGIWHFTCSVTVTVKRRVGSGYHAGKNGHQCHAGIKTDIYPMFISNVTPN